MWYNNLDIKLWLWVGENTQMSIVTTCRVDLAWHHMHTNMAGAALTQNLDREI